MLIYKLHHHHNQTFHQAFLLKIHLKSLCQIEMWCRQTMSDITGPHQIQYSSCMLQFDFVSKSLLAHSPIIATWRLYAVRCWVPSSLLGNLCAPVGGQIILSLLKRTQSTGGRNGTLYLWAEDIWNIQKANLLPWTSKTLESGLQGKSTSAGRNGYVGDCWRDWYRAHWNLWCIKVPLGLEFSLQWALKW